MFVQFRKYAFVFVEEELIFSFVKYIISIYIIYVYIFDFKDFTYIYIYIHIYEGGVVYVYMDGYERVYIYTLWV